MYCSQCRLIRYRSIGLDECNGKLMEGIKTGETLISNHKMMINAVNSLNRGNMNTFYSNTSISNVINNLRSGTGIQIVVKDINMWLFFTLH